MKPYYLSPVPIQNVTLEDEFWNPKRRVWRDVTIEHCLANYEKDGAIKNFDLVLEGNTGGHLGPLPLDGIFYEMITGCSDFLAHCADPELASRLDGYIERIAAVAALNPDGYVSTWTMLMGPDHRWAQGCKNEWGASSGADLALHDIWMAGALIEAAVHIIIEAREKYCSCKWPANMPITCAR